MSGFGRVVCASMLGLAAFLGLTLQASAQLSQYDCAAVMGSTPSNAVRHFRAGEPVGYDMYQTAAGALQCLHQTAPESRWLTKADADGSR